MSTRESTSRPAPLDPYAILLDPHLSALASAERDVCSHAGVRLAPVALDILRSSGVLAAPVPAQLGGSDADLLSTARALSRLAAVAPCTALALAMPLGNAANTRLSSDNVPPDAREPMRRGRAFIAERAREGRILAVANSEPGAGGELDNTRTLARLVDGQFLLTGKKSFATLGPDADFFLCVARREDGALDAFFVSRTARGVRLADDWNALGMRATASVGLTLEEAPASATFLYPGAIVGSNARHWSTLLIAAVLLGIGEGALASARGCVSRSSAWARAMIADAVLTLDAARGFLEAVAMDDAVPCAPAHAERCRRVKTFAARTALEVCTRCMTIAGGRAYRADHALARALLDAAAGPLLRPPLAHAMDEIAARTLDD
jgi:alkylation response protein AidB-like acyl-CoA dehydrogenase